MVTHYIVTNRGITTRRSKNYIPVNDKEYIRVDGDEEARDNLRYGTITFDPQKARKVTDFTINLLPDPPKAKLNAHAIRGVPPEGKEFPSRKVFRTLYRHGLSASKSKKKEQHILLFIHGFKADLDTVLRTLRDLHNNFVEPSESPIEKIVLFTWPAKDQLLKYRDDARDAVKSGYALARSIASLKDFFRDTFVVDGEPQCQQKIHLMSHSMGNRVLESMFVALSELNVEVTSIFGEILLMAADIDYDALEKPRPLYRVLDIGERVHVYYHNKDQALGISELTKNAFNRLGRWGTKNTLGLPDDVFQADVTDIADETGLMDGFIHHWYYCNSRSVVRDIIEVLNGNVSAFIL